MSLVEEKRPVENSEFSMQTAFNTSSDNMSYNSNSNTNQSPSNQQSSVLNNHNESNMVGSNNFQNENLNYSPLHLSSILQNVSLTGTDTRESQVSKTGSYFLKIRNVPSNITLRECFLIFSLATGISAVELVEDTKSSLSSISTSPTEGAGNINRTIENPTNLSIIAKFDSLSLVKLYASILNSKPDLFGSNHLSRYSIEVIDEISQSQIPYSKIVPSNSVHSNYQLTTSSSGLSNIVMPRMDSTPLSTSVNTNTKFQTKSRFSFSDPFNPDSARRNIQNPSFSTNEQLSLQMSQSNNSQQDLRKQTPTTQTRDVGKSFLLMEQDDINENIWNPNTIPSSMNTFQDIPPHTSSTPVLDWGIANNNNGNNNRIQNSSLFMSTNSNSVAGSISGSIAPTSIDAQSNNHNNMMTMNDSLQPGPYHLNSGHMLPQSVSQPPVISQDPTNQFIQQSMAANNFQNMMSNKFQGQPPSSNNNGLLQQDKLPNSSSMKNLNSIRQSEISKSGNMNLHPSASTISTVSAAGYSTISDADLSLLSKIPPPANPADQNPPCNTLYVGNLPPDATEQELRQLFTGQEGFRRLSFRNKNLNSSGSSNAHNHGHGPMCFVEFDDVSFATRALAELYGTQLPRATTSHKGGIRLSFSKNPLGVRGPNSRKSHSSSSPTSSSNAATNTSGSNNFNYLPNYNK